MDKQALENLILYHKESLIELLIDSKKDAEAATGQEYTFQTGVNFGLYRALSRFCSDVEAFQLDLKEFEEIVPETYLSGGPANNPESEE